MTLRIFLILAAVAWSCLGHAQTPLDRPNLDAAIDAKFSDDPTAPDLAPSDIATELKRITASAYIPLSDGTPQPLDSDLTIWAGLTPSPNAQSLVTAPDYAAMTVLLGLSSGDSPSFAGLSVGDTATFDGATLGTNEVFAIGVTPRLALSQSASVSASNVVRLTTFGASKYAGFAAGTSGVGYWGFSSNDSAYLSTGSGGAVVFGQFDTDPVTNGSSVFTQTARITSGGAIQSADGGSPASPAFSAADQPTTGMSITANQVVFSTVGATRFSISGNELVGNGSSGITFGVGGLDSTTGTVTFSGDRLAVGNTTASTSTTTGAQTIAGGLGVGGNGNFGGNLDSEGYFQSTRSTAGSASLSALVDGDSHARYLLKANGDQEWGDGANPRDVNLKRTGVDTLGTDDTFQARGLNSVITDSGTNDVVQVGLAYRGTTGTAADGFGLMHNTQLEDAAGGIRDAFQVETRWADATNYQAETILRTRNGVAGFVDALTLSPGGSVRFGDGFDSAAYGSHLAARLPASGVYHSVSQGLSVELSNVDSGGDLTLIWEGVLPAHQTTVNQYVLAFGQGGTSNIIHLRYRTTGELRMVIHGPTVSDTRTASISAATMANYVGQYCTIALIRSAGDDTMLININGDEYDGGTGSTTGTAPPWSYDPGGNTLRAGFDDGVTTRLAALNKAMSAAELATYRAYGWAGLQELVHEAGAGVHYASDFSAGAGVWLATNLTRTINVDQDADGPGTPPSNDWQKAVVDTNGTIDLYGGTSLPGDRKSYAVSADIYNAAGSSISWFRLRRRGTSTQTSEQVWGQVPAGSLGTLSGNIVLSSNNGELSVDKVGSSGDQTGDAATAGDTFYLKNVRIDRAGLAGSWDFTSGGGYQQPDLSGAGNHLGLATTGLQRLRVAPIGARETITFAYTFSEISTAEDTTVHGYLPPGWAYRSTHLNVSEAFNAGITLNLGDVTSATRFVSGQAVDTTGFKVNDSGQQTPLSGSSINTFYLQATGGVPSAGAVEITVFIERVF